MNFLAFIVFMTSMSLQAQAVYFTIYLRTDNFHEIIRKNNFFVIFVKNRSIPEFDSFYDKVAQLYNPDNKTKIKMGKVICKDNVQLCQDEHIGDEPITLKYYAKDGESFDYEAMASFFSSTIAEHVKNFLLEEATASKIKSGRSFVKFTVPYCGYCKKMAPTWVELEKEFQNNSEVSILSVDCKKYSEICDELDVARYPSLIWVEDGKRVDKYPGRRSLPDFKEYIEKMRRRSVRSIVAAPDDEPAKHESAILDFTADDFRKAISTDFSFVYFFLPTCSYCEQINLVWNELAKNFTSSSNIKIARVDCQSYGELCYKEIRGCPTLNIYSNGQKVLSDFYEDLSLEGLIDVITSHSKGGKDLDAWKVRNKAKKRARRAQKKKDNKAKALQTT